MTIHCENLAQMIDIIEELVGRGIGFKADVNRLLITLTGAC